MVYVPSSLLSAPSPMTGIATSTCPRGKPPSLVTFPVMVTGSWAGALATTSRASATAANTLRTMRRMMGPPGTAGNGRTASLPPRYEAVPGGDRKSTRLNSSHSSTSYAVFCLKKKKKKKKTTYTNKKKKHKKQHQKKKTQK